MKPLIDPAFWSDPDIEAHKAGVKLTAMWLITNSQTSLLGLCGASVTRFKFETGLPEEALQRALDALPRAFVKIGSVIFVRNYIRHQFGTGDKLTRNNFFVALKSLFLSVKDEELRAAILVEYPEFQQALTKPSEGLTKPKERKGKEGKGSAEGKPLPPLPQVLENIPGLGPQWEQFVQHRREIKKPLTPLAAGGILDSLCERPGEAVEALETAIRRSWQGFEWDWLDKERKNGKQRPKLNL